MNTIKSTYVFIFLCTVFSFISCDNEPLDPILVSQINTNSGGTGGSGGNGGTSVVGTYLLTAFNTSVPTDLNGDGVSSTNQMNETSCFNNSLIILNANNTFTATGGSIDIDLSTTPNTITCFTDPPFTGTWTLAGNLVTFNYIENGISYSDLFTVAGNTLVITEQAGEVVGTANGSPVFLTADISAIYTKQ